MDNPKKHTADHGAAGVKPKKPKHFHAGPNPVEEEEQKQSAVQAAPVSGPVPSPVSCLYSDALGAMFGFLSLGDLHRVLAVSREWSAAVCRTACLRHVRWCNQQALVRVVSSRLARHLCDFHGPLSGNDLYTLVLSMPQLTGLNCELQPLGTGKVIMPPKLKGLRLSLPIAIINAALAGIGQLTALAVLTLEFASWLPEMNFAPLAKCAALKVLTLKQPEDDAWETQPTDAHLDQLRALPHLRSVSIHYLDGSSLPQLLRAPHTLQWEELSGFTNIRAKSAAALCSLPGLLSLNAWFCHSVVFLPLMTRLQSLTLYINKDPWAVSADAVVEALSCCRQLDMLSLTAPVTSKHLSALLPHLALLHTLRLLRCSELESLAFLSDVVTLQHTLRELDLSQCRHPDLRSSELRHVLALKQLSSLKLMRSFTEPLGGFTQHFFTPPSAVLPKLTAFKSKPPAADDDDDEDDNGDD